MCIIFVSLTESQNQKYVNITAFDASDEITRHVHCWFLSSGQDIWY